MNSANDTVVAADFYKRLREAGVAEGYEQVPLSLQGEANRVLAGRQIATMSPMLRAATRKLTRNQRKAKRRAGVPGY